jgi:hypothetical protein
MISKKMHVAVIGLSLIVKHEFGLLDDKYNLPHAATIGAVVLTTITAGIISNPFKPAQVASFQVATEIRCSANLNSMHHLQIRQW